MFGLSFAYSDVRIDHRAHGWRATGRIKYALCEPDNFDLEFGQMIEKWRGWCLIRGIDALMVRGDRSTWARPYTSSGTGYSHFEIVVEYDAHFCIRRVGGECDY